MYSELLRIIHKILAENGETRTLRLLNMVSVTNHKIKIDEPLVFEHETINYRISIPITPEGSEMLLVDWGDGSIGIFRNRNIDFQEPNKEYNRNSTYRVKIYRIGIRNVRIYYFPYWGSTIKKIITLGDIGFTDLSRMFYNSNFDGIISPNWDLSRVTRMNEMFAYSLFSGKIPLN